MVVDSSVLIAILEKEPERVAFIESLSSSPTSFLAAPTLVEAAMVAEKRKGAVGRNELDMLILKAGLTVVAFDAAQAELARIAWRSYGKGRHPAGLNFGDCFSYALAKHMNNPLLYKGKDFSLTDIVPALV
jgi:ribonuclease VapC